MDMSPTYCEFCFWDREIDCKIGVKNMTWMVKLIVRLVSSWDMGKKQRACMAWMFKRSNQPTYLVTLRCVSRPPRTRRRRHVPSAWVFSFFASLNRRKAGSLD